MKLKYNQMRSISLSTCNFKVSAPYITCNQMRSISLSTCRFKVSAP